MIYLDNNATTRPAPEVVAAMLPYLGDLYANPSSAHGAGMAVKQAIGQARGSVAGLMAPNPPKSPSPPAHRSQPSGDPRHAPRPAGAPPCRDDSGRTPFQSGAVPRSRQGYHVTILPVMAMADPPPRSGVGGLQRHGAGFRHVGQQ